MNNLTKTRIEAIRVIDKAITLICNVDNGCWRDEDDMIAITNRLPKLKEWAIANNQMPAIKNWFSSVNHGMDGRFIATDLKFWFMKEDYKFEYIKCIKEIN